MKHIISLTILFLVSLTIINGCSRTVTRTSIDKTIDLSGHWNDTDSRLTAEEMINDCLERPWVNSFTEKNKRTPVIIVGTITNRSHEHINSQLFTKDLERSLLNSGRVTIVASTQERQEIREERTEQQQGLTEKSTVKPIGYETGADYMLTGVINSVKDEIKGKYVILYQVNLELIDLTSNQKVWIGQKEIKKLIKYNSLKL